MIRLMILFTLIMILPTATDSSLAQGNTDSAIIDYHITKENDSLKYQLKVRLKLDSLINSKDSINAEKEIIH